jgi:CheY-like chemotaxis protein
MAQAKPVILVVEDNKVLRLSASALLEQHGFGVVEAENSDRALKLLETRNDVQLLSPTLNCQGLATGWI